MSPVVAGTMNVSAASAVPENGAAAALVATVTVIGVPPVHLQWR
jgi:hypothetical protein